MIAKILFAIAAVGTLDLVPFGLFFTALGLLAAGWEPVTLRRP